jgi:hypothetical protein
VFAKEMVDFSTICSHFESILHLQFQIPEAYICFHMATSVHHSCRKTQMGWWTMALTSLMSQMPVTLRSSRKGITPASIPNFLTHLSRMTKFLEICKLRSLCHIAVRVEKCKEKTGLRQSYTCQNFCHICGNYKQLPCCMWCGGSPAQGMLGRRAIHHRNRHAATESWWTERNHIPQNIEAAATPRTRCKRESRTKDPRLQREEFFFQPHHPWTVISGEAVQQHTVTQQQQQP